MNKTARLDCRGLQCPQPVIQTKDALAAKGSGSLVVLVDNEAACANVSRFSMSQGHVVHHQEQNGQYEIHIEKGEGTAPGSTLENPCMAGTITSSLVVYINTESMGRGDETLGRILMAAYMETLLHFASQITHVLLVNGGVKLACEGAEVLSQLEELAGMGIDVQACGTCLKYFGLQEKLVVGKVSNMFTIIDILSKAGKTLTP